jgi:predicted NBD/HSP70 family sugar kinase
MADKLTIGVDLGGTKILAVAVDAKGVIRARAKDDTPGAKGLEGVAARMQELATQALAEIKAGWDDVGELGIAVPASVDPATGVVLHSPALGWKNQAARDVFRTVFKRPVRLDNDVNCGVLAEAKLGAGRGFKCVVGYFVGRAPAAASSSMGSCTVACAGVPASSGMRRFVSAAASAAAASAAAWRRTAAKPRLFGAWTRPSTGSA